MFGAVKGEGDNVKGLIAPYWNVNEDQANYMINLYKGLIAPYWNVNPVLINLNP